MIKRTLRCKRNVSVICGLIGQSLKHKAHIPTRWSAFYFLCLACYLGLVLFAPYHLFVFQLIFSTLTFSLTRYISDVACFHFFFKKHSNVQKQILCQNPTEPLFGQYGMKKIAEFGMTRRSFLISLSLILCPYQHP